MIRTIFTFTATALPILAFALTPSAASAQTANAQSVLTKSFTGNYPVSLTQTECGLFGEIKCGNQSYCLKLTDDGNFGRPHSGPATLESFVSSPVSGSFQVIGNTILVTFGTASGNGEAGIFVLVAPANPSTGVIGTGIYGQSEASALATFGVKNGC